MARVLVVDDVELNVELLRAQLEEEGHEIVTARSGEEAIERFRTHDPDIVLLDMLMPGMGGLEALRRLKIEAQPEFLPVILVTALDDAASRQRGFEAGADDFVTKPVDATVLQLRVTNLVAQRSARRALRERNAELALLQRYKEEMTALLVHDLKNPAAVVLANLEFVHGHLPDGTDADLTTALSDARECCQRLLRLFATLLDIERAEDDRLRATFVPTDIAELLEPLVRVRALTAKSLGLRLDVEVDRGEARVDPSLIERMVENLLDNALAHTPREGHIRLEAHLESDELRIRVGNTGAPIPREGRAVVFEKYGRLHREHDAHLGAGLGLYFCKLAARSHGGDIVIEETAELPTVFVARLPAHPEEATS